MQNQKVSRLFYPLSAKFLLVLFTIALMTLVINTAHTQEIGETSHMERGLDTDGDGVPDNADNCLLVANADQRDTDNVPTEFLTTPTIIVQMDSRSYNNTFVEYITTAAPDGSYAIEIDHPSPAFVSVIAQGVGDQSSVRLKSLAGSAFTLRSFANSAGVIDSSVVPTLKVSLLTTSYAVLVEDLTGGLLRWTDNLTDFDKQLDAPSLLRFAAGLNVAIHTPDVVLPNGAGNTLEVFKNPTIRANYLAYVHVNFATELSNAINSTLTSNQAPYTAPELIGAMYTSLAVPTPTDGARSFDFNSDGTVNYSDNTANASGNWSIDADGAVVISFATPLLSTVFTTQIDDPDNPGQFVTTEEQTFIEEVMLQRFRDGQRADHLVVLDRGFKNFPGYPQIGNISYDTIADPRNAYVSYTSSTFAPFSAFALTNYGFASKYMHQDNNSAGTADPTIGYDTLVFLADNTGSTVRRGFRFNWQIVNGGEVLVTFANGDTTRFRRFYSMSTNIFSAMVFSSVNGGPEVSRRSVLIDPDESLAFDHTNLVDIRYRSAVATDPNAVQGILPVFDFTFFDAGVACRNPGNASSIWAWSTVDGRVEMTRTFVIDPGVFYYRTWESIAQVGDSYYVLETLQISDDGSPPVVVSQTPGRLNVYTMQADYMNNLRPVLVDDAFTTTSDTPITMMLFDIVGNDFDPEGDQVFLRNPGNGVNTSNGGLVAHSNPAAVYPDALTYTPPAGFTGTDTWVYDASDFACLGMPLDNATITINVN